MYPFGTKKQLFCFLCGFNKSPVKRKYFHGYRKILQHWDGFVILLRNSFCRGNILQIKREKGLLDMAMNITKTNFEAEVLQADKPVLLDFWASWCGPCRMVAPVIEEIGREMAGVKVGKVNVDEQRELAAQFGIMSIPTLVVMKDGKIVKKSVGAMPKQAILGMLRQVG
jgi:thioredoxin 1